jgi:hypothetical protein
MSGKAVITQQVKNNQIDVSRLQKGMYSIKIEDESGVVTRKFVMQ